MTAVVIPNSTGTVSLDLPDGWQVRSLPIAQEPHLTLDEMRAALANPIGTPRIRELAHGKRNAVVLVDDLTRPTPAHSFVPLILEELHAGGLAASEIKFIAGIGLHRPMSGPQFRLKLGDEIVDRYECRNHNAFEHHVHIGDTKCGTRAEINLEVAEADLKIAAGGIIPHHNAGFGGGGKLIMPGVCSIETVLAAHAVDAGMSYNVKGNVFRAELEEIARLASLDVIVNCVLNAQGGVGGLFVGDLVAAHRAGVRAAWSMYTVEAPTEADLAIISTFPKDRHYALHGLGCARTVRPGGTVLVLSAGSEGTSLHYWGERDRIANRNKPPEPRRIGLLGDRHLMVCCPGVGLVEAHLPEGASFYRDLDAALAEMRDRHEQAVVNVFPQGGITILGSERRGGRI